MGREVRRVPPNWEHPLKDNGHDQPMFKNTYESARAEWLAGLAAHKPEDHDGADYWEWWGEPPDRAYYRPWKDEDATWWQLWETVSEGTPVTPPFETREELISWLAEFGDEWDQNRGDGGWGRDAAEAFVSVGYAPSMVVSDGRVLMSKDIPLAMKDREGQS